MHLQKLKHHVYYTDAATETGILAPNRIEDNITRHIVHTEWSAIHIDEHAIITAHANDINSFKDDNRYDIMKQQFEEHKIDYPNMTYIIGIDANTTLPTEDPHIGTHSTYKNKSTQSGL